MPGRPHIPPPGRSTWREHALEVRAHVSPISLFWVRSSQRGASAYCEVVNLGPHATTCEPKGESNAIHRAVIDTAAGASGERRPGQFLRTSMGRARTRRSPCQKHAGLSGLRRTHHIDRGSAQADNDGGVAPNYRSLGEIVATDKLFRRGDRDFLLFDRSCSRHRAIWNPSGAPKFRGGRGARSLSEAAGSSVHHTRSRRLLLPPLLIRAPA